MVVSAAAVAAWILREGGRGRGRGREGEVHPNTHIIIIMGIFGCYLQLDLAMLV